MAVQKIDYENKIGLQNDENVPNKNKVTDEDMNQIKSKVNNNADELSTAQQNIEDLQEGQGTASSEITSLENRVTTLEKDNTKNKQDIANKVDKVEGKGLSTEDYTTAEKEKLAGLSNYNDTEIKQDIQDLKDDVSDIKTEQESQNNLLQRTQNALINITTPKSSNVNVKDSSDLNAKIDVFGISEQETREGYNLFNNTKTISNVTYNSEEDKWVFNLPGKYDHIASKGTFFKNIKANTNYTLYFNILKNTSSAAILFNLTNTIWNNNIQISAGQTGVVVNNIKTKEDLSTALYDLWFSHSNAITGEFEAQIMICEGSETDNNYVKYQEQLIPFPLAEGQKLYDKDYPASDGIHHVRKQIELDGTENWQLTARDGYYAFWLMYNAIGMVDRYNKKICTHFPYYSQIFTEAPVNSICENSGSPNLIIFKVDFCTTIEEWKTYLAQQKANGTPVILEYELAEEEIEPYTEEQQEAYDKLQNVLSYYNVTNVFTDKAQLVFKYIADTTEKIENEGNVYSRPILRLEKTICNEVDIMIEDLRFQYNFNDEEYVEIDCEEKEVKYEGLNRNRKIQIGYEFPKLKVGESKIKMYEGDCIIKAKRKDRWL